MPDKEESSYKDKQDTLNPEQFSLKKFMRARRPELYSDSLFIGSHSVDASYLNFVLSQVTERKAEVEFERLCRQLAEKEICPNLIPQTGPTGGGDSKVDTETYPVSESIAERWYVADPLSAASQRWAFAFSAKQTWRSKVRDDVEKIMETGRQYSKVFFFTNQQVSDRNRSIVEDELRKKWHVDVRIFDRNWIAERVIKNKHFTLFENALHVDLNATSNRKLGPDDAVRECRIAELDSQIEDSDRYVGLRDQLVEDCLETALIARGLERPREEVDNRFSRAEHIAETMTYQRPMLRVLYHRAWTAACWYEDYEEFERVYKKALSLVFNDNDVWDYDMITTLWQIGTTFRVKHRTLHEDQEWKQHTTRLEQVLDVLSQNEQRLTSSLMAKTLRTIIRITLDRDHETFVLGLSEIVSILEVARNRLDYPLETIAQLVEEVINLRGNDETLDELQEQVLQLQLERQGKSREGCMRLERAKICISKGRFSEAVNQGGKAQLLLGQGGHEGFQESVIVTGSAYEAMGLLWAARANYALALDWMFREWDKTGEYPRQLFVPLKSLIWIELQIGRPSQALRWLKLYRNLLNRVELPESELEEIVREDLSLDFVLAILVLRTPWSLWPKLLRIPTILEAFFLKVSAGAAKFMLGHESAFKEEMDCENPEAFFRDLLKEPVADDLSEQTDWGVCWPINLTTTLFGCQIELKVHCGLRSFHLGETILAFLESMLATHVKEDWMFAARAKLCIEIVTRDTANCPFECDRIEDEFGEVHIKVAHKNPTPAQPDEKYVKSMLYLFAIVLEQLWLPTSKEDVEKLYKIDRAPDRAGITTHLPVILDSIFGTDAKINVNSWISPEMQSVPLVRKTPWVPQSQNRYSLRGTKENANNRFKTKTASDIRPPAWGVDGLRHRDARVISVINIPLWELAGWGGLGYGINGSGLPEMYFAFKNFGAGLKIFKGWIAKFGTSDLKDDIAISIVTDVDEEHPFWYRAVVGCRDNEVYQSDSRLTGFISRIQEMHPSNPTSLRLFINRYESTKKFLIAPVDLRKDIAKQVLEQNGPYIAKQELNIVPASNIGPNDLLKVALRTEPKSR